MTEAKIISLKEYSNPIDKEVTNIDTLDNNNKFDGGGNRQNFLSLNDRVIFQKWHTEITLVINK